MMWWAIYALGGFGAMAFKAYHDAVADRPTNLWAALLTGVLWPLIWPVMAGQVYGARQRRRSN